MLMQEVEMPHPAPAGSWEKPVVLFPAARRPESDRDELTGLWNRGAFEADCRQEEPGLGSSCLAVVYVDVDHFKKVNDEHGHALGDAVLRGVAERLSAAAHGKGDGYRYGGEELILVLRNHTLEEGAAVAERVRRTIAATPMAGVAVTASCGVSASPTHGTTMAVLREAADRALYDAKHSGRNKVCSASSSARTELVHD
jgi:diguanylate cyclase (GGDEF)-like protein